jgi:MFS family permease
VLNFCQFVPILALVPWTWSAADRFDRRRLLLFTQTVAVGLGVAIAALAWASLAPTALVILFALGFGVIGAYSAPAQQALVTQLVPAHEIPSAVALNSMTFNLARAVGPALGALSVSQLGIAGGVRRRRPRRRLAAAHGRHALPARGRDDRPSRSRHGCRSPSCSSSSPASATSP